MSTHNVWKDLNRLCLGLAVALGLTMFVALVQVMSVAHRPSTAWAQDPTIYYVAPAPIGDDDSDCTDYNKPCGTLQHAVDSALTGDEIRVATGIYTDVQARGAFSQVVYINKTVTIQGGYSTTNWNTPYAITQPTTLDAHGQGRVLYITGNISPTIDGFIITGGDTSGGGGGVAIYSSSPMLSHNIITNNHTTDYGGGVYVIGSSASPTLDTNWIISNSTTSNGGGVFIDDYSSPVLANTVVAKNCALSNGGGIYVDYYSEPTLVNNSVVDNDCGPYDWANEGIFMYDCPTVTIVNNNIVGHSRGIEGSPCGGTIDYNNVWDCSATSCYGGVGPGFHDISVDPRFVDRESGNYHLSCSSPVMDVGTGGGAPLNDFDDEPRPYGAGVDIGADERHGQCYGIYMPIILRNQ
jgi:parallel beta-helix repeat protein